MSDASKNALALRFATIALALIFLTVPAQATLQDGLGLEAGAGYSRLTFFDDNQQANYAGIATQINLLFPLLNAGRFSMDLDILYRYTALENNTISAGQTEWAHQSTYRYGIRLNYSYLFAGYDFLNARVKQVQTGENSQSFEYKYNPSQWHVGFSLPLSPVSSGVIGYSQTLNNRTTIAGTEFNSEENIFWLKIQIDFGISFLNLLAPEESFQSTRDGFFVN